jgi:hypothetical protein
MMIRADDLPGKSQRGINSGRKILERFNFAPLFPKIPHPGGRGGAMRMFPISSRIPIHLATMDASVCNTLQRFASMFPHFSPEFPGISHLRAGFFRGIRRVMAARGWGVDRACMTPLGKNREDESACLHILSQQVKVLDVFL